MFRDQMAEKCETTSEKSSETFDIEISELKITGLSKSGDTLMVSWHTVRSYVMYTYWVS